MDRSREARSDIGRYVSFYKEDGSALSWLQPVKNFMPNGLHAILLAKGPVVRLDMYRFETSYDLLMTSHTLVAEEGKQKPKLETKLIFFHRFGILERELWGKDKMFRGAISPQFFMSNGSEAAPLRNPPCCLRSCLFARCSWFGVVLRLKHLTQHSWIL